MLQRYDIARNNQTNRLSIREYAVIDKKTSARNNFKPAENDYLLINEISYDGGTIRTAISKGYRALISELRSGDFFPISPCIEIIARSVSDLYNGNPESIAEVHFDDRKLLSTPVSN